ncbi:MAG: histidine kinase [Chloroflexi bacterium]|nr:MAG: histidine kinase [Chloroflexota bacterium]
MPSPRATPEQIDLHATLKMILNTAVEALQGSAGVVATWSEVEHRFVATESCGLDARALDRLRTLMDESLTDLATSRESFDLLSELQTHRLPLPSSEKGQTLNPIIALPLQVGGEFVGLIYVLRPYDAAAFSSADQPILAAFAQQAAIAVQNARLAYLLAEEKRRVESILEGSAEGIMSIDAQRRIVRFNSAMERLTGYSREDVLGKQCSSVLNLRRWDGSRLCIAQCPMLKQTGDASSTSEQQGRIQTKDGQNIDVSMVYSIIRSPEGQPRNAVINVRDITRLREIESLRATFLSMLGHEVQTPLSIIKGYTSTLARSDGNWTESTLREGLQVIEGECDRLSKMMSRLLLASRIETGSLTLKKEELQLPSLVSKVVRRFETMTRIHTFTVSFEPGFPAVYADPELTEEVVTNLIDNAVKYSPEGGEIGVTGKVSNEHVEVTVADEGIGIPLREVDRIFEQFHRVNSGPVQRIRGVGLGLYICKYILEAHGGSIRVTSQLGKGSQFTLTLPRCRGAG